MIEATNLTKKFDDILAVDHINAQIREGSVFGLIGTNGAGKSTFLRMAAGVLKPDEGSIKWGVSTSRSYFPKDNSEYFDGCSLNLMDWLRQFSPEGYETQNETYIRGFLGRMLFSGDDVYKEVQVLSGGEKVRCMLSRMMLFGSNVLILDQPTNHLDLESITAVNNGLTAFKGNVIFACHDHEFVNTVANRIIEIKADGSIVDRMCTYDEYIEMKKEGKV